MTDNVPEDAPWDVDIRIDTPLAAHAPIEPRAAVADINQDGGRVWIGSQDPFFVRDFLGDRLGFGDDDLTILPMRTGGGFGGKAIPLAEIEAAALSLAAGRPVKVEWTRAHESSLAYHRPATSQWVRAQMLATKVQDWSHRMASGHVIYSSAVLPPWMQALTDLIGDDGAARNLATPYVIGARSIGYDLDRLPIRTAAWRGLGAGPNTLASEIAMEATAGEARVDPVDFRLSHIRDDRLKTVLSATRELAGTASHKGRGVGCGIYKGVS
ncbi:MAG: molybdopterin cofactor-binding domain-containing protein [Pseudomonadota bacterium]